MHIRGNRQYSCKLKFKEQSILDRSPHQVHDELSLALTTFYFMSLQFHWMYFRTLESFLF